jgi:hypothetical protein
MGNSMPVWNAIGLFRRTLVSSANKLTSEISVYWCLSIFRVQPKARNLFAGSNTRIIGSNPSQGMSARVLFYVCVGLCRSPACCRGDHPSKESYKLIIKGKAIPVMGRGDPYGCETSRLLHVLDNRFTDGGEVINLKHRSPYSPRNIPGIHFC